MIFLRTYLLVGFLCSSISLQCMLPLFWTVCDTAQNIIQLENMMNVPRTMGISGGATLASGEATLFSGFASFDCSYDRFQCINETHSTCREYCSPRRIVFGGYYDENLVATAHHDADLTDCMRIAAAITPVVVCGIRGIGEICRVTPLRLKEIAKLTAYSTLYTAGCLYAFENNSDRGEAAYWLTGSLMAIGNALISGCLAQR